MPIVCARGGEVDTHGDNQKEDLNGNRITRKLDDTRAIEDEMHKQPSPPHGKTKNQKNKKI